MVSLQLVSPSRSAIHAAWRVLFGFVLLVHFYDGRSCYALDLGNPESQPPGQNPVSTLSAREVQRKLGLIDARYLAGCSLSGLETIEPSFLHPGVGQYKVAWRTTRSPTEFAYELRVDGIPQFEYIPRGRSAFTDYDDQGNMVIAFPDEQLYYFCETQRVEKWRVRSYRVTQANVVTEEGTGERVDIFPPDAPGPTLVMKKTLWAAGRGFSPFLEAITSVRSENDLISVSATGSDGPNSHGIWNLTIDRSAAYLVVAASYTREGRSSPTLALKNSGRKAKAECMVAASSAWTTFVGAKSSTAIERTAVEFGVDQEFLRTARSGALGPHPKTTQVVDRRTPDRQGPTAQDPQALPDAGRAGRIGYVIALNAVVISGLLASWGIRSWRRSGARKRHST
jgi:hypothetical protein